VLTAADAISDVLKTKGTTKRMKTKIVTYIKKNHSSRWVALLGALSSGESFNKAVEIASKA
jgi:hypothetical protein